MKIILWEGEIGPFRLTAVRDGELVAVFMRLVCTVAQYMSGAHYDEVIDGAAGGDLVDMKRRLMHNMIRDIQEFVEG